MKNNSVNAAMAVASIWLSSLIVTCFVTLKLTGYIASSWWLVLGPLWIPVAIALLLSILASIVAMIGK